MSGSGEKKKKQFGNLSHETGNFTNSPPKNVKSKLTFFMLVFKLNGVIVLFMI